MGSVRSKTEKEGVNGGQEECTRRSLLCSLRPGLCPASGLWQRTLYYLGDERQSSLPEPQPGLENRPRQQPGEPVDGTPRAGRTEPGRIWGGRRLGEPALLSLSLCSLRPGLVFR